MQSLKKHLKLIVTAMLLLHMTIAWSQTVTIRLSNKSLEEAVLEIAKQANHEVFYQRKQLQNTKRVTLTMNGMPIQKALDAAFKDQPVTYKIANNTIIISAKPAEKKAQLASDQESLTVTGTIKDMQGAPMGGITVQVVGTENITTTNQHGNYTLYRVDPIASIRIQGIHIVTAYAYVQGKTVLDFIVSETQQEITEVVVNKGYYSEKKTLSTGNAISIKSEDILKTPSTNPLLSLQGRVPGLIIETTSGLPGAMQNVQIRGQNSMLNSNEPLYIINSVPYNSNSLSYVGSFKGYGSALQSGLSPLANLNPNDIEEITVLKDADATAIYGSRGANGVILITTKKAIIGKTRINLDYSTAISKYPSYLKLLNTSQYLEMRNEAFRNDGRTPSSDMFGARDYDVDGTWDQQDYTDWQHKLLSGAGIINNVQGSISGGSNQTQFVIGGGYRTQSLPYNYSEGFGDKSASIRSSINHLSSNDKFGIRLDLSYVNNNNTMPTSDLTNAALTLPPNAPSRLLNDDGSLNWENNTFNNPLSVLNQTVNSNSENMMGNMELQYKITKDLTIKSDFSYNQQRMHEIIKIPGTSLNPSDDPFLGRKTSIGDSKVNSWIIEPQIQYLKNFGPSSFSILMGSTFQKQNTIGTGLNVSGFSSDAALDNYVVGMTKTFLTPQFDAYNYSAVFTRLNYSFRDRYVVNVTASRDGSSNFGRENQFGNFGSIGAAWLFTKEEFVGKNSVLNFGKIRVNYGITGNDKIQSLNYIGTYSNYNDFTYGGLNGLLPSRIPNPATAWETNKKLNIGVDLELFSDRVSIATDYYHNRSGNQLVQSPLPSTAGFQSVVENLPAIISNSGLEIILRTKNFKNSDFQWTTSFNIGFQRNKLVSFPDIELTSYSSRYTVGKPVSVLQLYRFNGIDPLTGLYSFEDLNHDGNISFNADRIAEIDMSPRFSGGLNNNFSYKGFNLDIFLQFVKKSGRNFLTSFPNPGQMSNYPIEVMDRWSFPGDNALYQRFSTNDYRVSTAFNNYSQSNITIVDASYLHLKNINLSYNISTQALSRLKIDHMQLYINGDNLLVFTPYLGSDPEVGGRTLPPLRTFTFGTRLSF